MLSIIWYSRLCYKYGGTLNPRFDVVLIWTCSLQSSFYVGVFALLCKVFFFCIARQFFVDKVFLNIIPAHNWSNYFSITSKGNVGVVPILTPARLLQPLNQSQGLGVRVGDSTPDWFTYRLHSLTYYSIYTCSMSCGVAPIHLNENASLTCRLELCVKLS